MRYFRDWPDPALLEQHKSAHVEFDAHLDSDLTRRQQNAELEKSAGRPRGEYEAAFRQRAHAELAGAQERERQALTERHARERGAAAP